MCFPVPAAVNASWGHGHSGGAQPGMGQCEGGSCYHHPLQLATQSDCISHSVQKPALLETTSMQAKHIWGSSWGPNCHSYAPSLELKLGPNLPLVRNSVVGTSLARDLIMVNAKNSSQFSNHYLQEIESQEMNVRNTKHMVEIRSSLQRQSKGICQSQASKEPSTLSTHTPSSVAFKILPLEAAAAGWGVGD